ncbi:MAG: LemA family protein [Elusimicrobia bacterium]|nr:LemA family protein [Elusimicrobiota bacterium]
MALVLFLVFVMLAGVALSYFMTIYNGLVALKNNILKAWANIDVLLKQRHDELPKLIKTCEGYMNHERAVFDKVLQAREALMRASGPGQKGQAEGELQGAIRQLFALAENYPDLKAQASFQQLQARITSLESEIADRREFYNDSVNVYNIRILSFPDMFFARSMGFSAQEMFKVAEAERQDVSIEFKAS